ncbi:MAG: 3-deoxy-7-phosphoheptulonate synthase [Lysobacterales bacterium]
MHNLNRVDFYTSHEKRCCCRTRKREHAAGAAAVGLVQPRHAFPWISLLRTAALGGAHVEYFRGIRNPIALKVGPSVAPDQLLRLVDVLNPDDEPRP